MRTSEGRKGVWKLFSPQLKAFNRKKMSLPDRQKTFFEPFFSSSPSIEQRRYEGTIAFFLHFQCSFNFSHLLGISPSSTNVSFEGAVSKVLPPKEKKTVRTWRIFKRKTTYPQVKRIYLREKSHQTSPHKLRPKILFLTKKFIKVNDFFLYLRNNANILLFCEYFKS